MVHLIKQIISKVRGDPETVLTLAPTIRIDEGTIPGVGNAIEEDACYLELYVESLRLERARSFATKFHGAVYAFLSLAREGDVAATIAAISKPEKLAELDSGSLDSVITISKQVVGPTAYRGGPVSLELGLFSIKSGNLLSPVLDFVTRVSDAAGNSYVGAIKPFLPLISEGMDMIAGQTKDVELEVGLDTDMSLQVGCVAAVIDCPKGSIDADKLTLDVDRRLLLDGRPVDHGHVVFSIRSTTRKPDYGEIPELKERYAGFLTALRSGSVKSAQDAHAAFRLAVIASQDLITLDAKRLIDKARAKLELAYPPGGTAGPTGRAASKHDESLADIGLYD